MTDPPASHCLACGIEQRAGARYCRNCGAALDGAEAPRSLPPSARAAKHQITVALASYFAFLAVSLTLFTMDHVSVVTLRGVCLAMALATLVALALSARLSPHMPSLGTVIAWPRMTWPLAATTVLGVLVALSAAQVLGLFFPFNDGDQMAQYVAEDEGLWHALADYSLITPLLEETLFRGVILGALMAPFGRRGAMWASSLMFATIHLSPVTFVHHTLLGLVCAHARLESRSLLLPMAIHGVYNAIVVFMAWPG
jgi:hypothetical protein